MLGMNPRRHQSQKAVNRILISVVNITFIYRPKVQPTSAKFAEVTTQIEANSWRKSYCFFAVTSASASLSAKINRRNIFHISASDSDDDDADDDDEDRHDIVRENNIIYVSVVMARQRRYCHS